MSGASSREGAIFERSEVVPLGKSLVALLDQIQSRSLGISIVFKKNTIILYSTFQNNHYAVYTQNTFFALNLLFLSINGKEKRRGERSEDR